MAAKYSRRHVIRSWVGGSLIFPAIVAELLQADEAAPARTPRSDPLAPREPHFAAKARRVIFLFSTGGV
ncbi:MAG: DUF1501 domain-containing protein, partial [Gemmataceae bacterium]|nr:DUF1501 domain-containing protein [Gemmataceae bacterium]